MSTSLGENVILTIKEVADYLKVTAWAIDRRAAANMVPAFEVGGTR